MAKIYTVDLPLVRKNTKLIEITGIYSMFEAHKKPEFYFQGECHSAWEMVYIMEGFVGVSADDKVYSLTKGDVIFHKPMEFHKIWSENNSDPKIFIFSFDLEGTLAYKLKNGVYRLRGESSSAIKRALSALEKERPFPENTYEEIHYIHRKDEVSPFTLQVAINNLELLLLNLAGSDDGRVPEKSSDNVYLYTKIVGILEKNAYGSITIEEVARECMVSSATVKNCFAEYAGCGVHKYFLKIKIRIAIELLRQGKSVSEVSEMLQFGNPNYFSYVFKRETGRCASEYR